MKGDLIIKDVDLDQLEKDLKTLEEVYEDFQNSESQYMEEGIERAGVRVLGMLKTWAEDRKAEKEDEEFAEELTTELLLNAVENRTEVKAAVLYVLKAQRKRLGK